MLNLLRDVFASFQRSDLIALKRAAGRKRDMEDVRLLELGDEGESP
jgi:hypothetical protein